MIDKFKNMICDFIKWFKGIDWIKQVLIILVPLFIILFILSDERNKNLVFFFTPIILIIVGYSFWQHRRNKISEELLNALKGEIETTWKDFYDKNETIISRYYNEIKWEDNKKETKYSYNTDDCLKIFNNKYNLPTSYNIVFKTCFSEFLKHCDYKNSEDNIEDITSTHRLFDELEILFKENKELNEVLSNEKYVESSIWNERKNFSTRSLKIVLEDYFKDKPQYTEIKTLITNGSRIFDNIKNLQSKKFIPKIKLKKK